MPVEVTGQGQLYRALDSVVARSGDLRHSGKAIAARVHGLNREQLDSGGARSGGYEDLSEAYAKQKARTHPGKGIERRDDALYESLTTPDATGSIYEIEKDHVSVGSSLAHAARQHYGDDSTPARPSIVIQEPQREELFRIYCDDLTEYARGLGLN